MADDPMTAEDVTEIIEPVMLAREKQVKEALTEQLGYVKTELKAELKELRRSLQALEDNLDARILECVNSASPSLQFRPAELNTSPEAGCSSAPAMTSEGEGYLVETVCSDEEEDEGDDDGANNSLLTMSNLGVGKFVEDFLTGSPGSAKINVEQLQRKLRKRFNLKASFKTVQTKMKNVAHKMKNAQQIKRLVSAK